MKATDLMVGDWVSIPILERNAKVIRVGQSIIDTDVCPELEKEGLEPIPLTPEILEKNGFKKEEHGLFWKSSHNVYDINGFPIIYVWVSFWKKGCIREVEISNIDTFYKDKIKQLDTYYVHQLQQALKLCKIDKDIVL